MYSITLSDDHEPRPAPGFALHSVVCFPASHLVGTRVNTAILGMRRRGTAALPYRAHHNHVLATLTRISSGRPCFSMPSYIADKTKAAPAALVHLCNEPSLAARQWCSFPLRVNLFAEGANREGRNPSEAVSGTSQLEHANQQVALLNESLASRVLWIFPFGRVPTSV